MTTDTTVTSIPAAHNIGNWNCAREMIIKYPRPRPVASHSATIAPRIEPSAEIRTDAKRLGRALGSRTFHTTVHGAAPYNVSTSTACGDAERSPCSTFTNV